MKVLLISDSSINVNRGGFPQTLYNILSFLNPSDLLFITSLQAYRIAPPSPPFDVHVLTYNLELIPFQRNRFAKYINGIINQINYGANSFLNRFTKLKSAIKNFNADAVIVAPNSPEGVFIYNQLKDAFRYKKVFPYFMDDWLYQSKLRWPGGNIHLLASKLLESNSAWMMVSESLGNILAKRYSLHPKEILTIHNPVNIQGFIKPKPVTRKSIYTIAYAGALWQMHFDAFIIIAKAIQLLKKNIAVKLIVYTSKSNWNWRRQELESLDVEYGGYIPYEQIHSTLAKADCLLLTSSFTKEWQTHSEGSIQTKIADYLKAGRLIIACGPSYAANHAFLKKHNCGICIEKTNIQEVAIALQNITDNIETNQAFVQQGYKVLEQELNFEIVHKRLKQFLAA